MASNPVIGILLSELPPTLSLLPPPSPRHPSPLKHGAKSKRDLIDQSCCFIHLCLKDYIYIYIYKVYFRQSNLCVAALNIYKH